MKQEAGEVVLRGSIAYAPQNPWYEQSFRPFQNKKLTLNKDHEHDYKRQHCFLS